MSIASKPGIIKMPSAAEDRAITKAAKADPDAQPLTDEQLKAMVPLRTLRGRPKSENPQQLVSVRYSPEVLIPSTPQRNAFVTHQLPGNCNTKVVE